MAITKSEAQAADRVVQALVETYRVTIVRDWGEEEGGGWSDGYWSLDEVHLLRDAVTDLAGAMGGAEQWLNNFSGFAVRQVKTRYRGLAGKREIKFTAAPVSFDKWTAVHEMGHVWDAQHGWRLSKALRAYTGGHACWPCGILRWLFGSCDEDRRWPGCNRFGYFYGGPPPAGSDANLNRKEDFSEAVAAYLYPDLARARVERFRDDERYREFLYYADYVETKRWAFIDGLMKGEIVP